MAHGGVVGEPIFKLFSEETFIERVDGHECATLSELVPTSGFANELDESVASVRLFSFEFNELGQITLEI